LRLYGRAVGWASDHGRCRNDSKTTALVANARWLPYNLADGVADELVPFSSVLEQIQAFDKAGLRYRFTAYPADHMAWNEQDDFSDVIAHLGHPVVVRNPGTIHYSWYPDGSSAALGLGPTGAYWLRNLHARTSHPGQLATVDAASGARPITPYAVVKSHSPALPGTPAPGVTTTESWKAIDKPAPPRRATLALTLRNVAGVAVDPIRAGFTPGQHVTVTVRTDGATTLIFGLTVVHLHAGTSTFTI
jgi:hypothetical protein